MKKLRYLLPLLSLVLLLAACGAEEASPMGTLAHAPPETAATESPVERTVITAVVARHSQQTEQWWEDFARAFGEANPAFALEVTCVDWHDINAAIRDRIAAGNTPDLVNTDSFRPYQESSLLLPAQEWVSPETYAKFYPSLHIRATAGGTVWGVPDHVSPRALYYNRDILDAAGLPVPATWQELTDVCQALRIFDQSLYPWGVDMTTDEGYATFACCIWNNGSDFMDASGNWTLDDPRNLTAVEFLTEMVHRKLTNPDPTSQTRYALQELFGQGKVAMMIAPSTLPAYCAASGATVNYGIAPLPANGGNPSVSTASGNFLLCFADENRPPEELAAITALADAFYEDAAYAQWIRMEGFVPATTTANALLQPEDGDMAVWHEILGSLKFYPPTEHWGIVREDVVHVLQNALWHGNGWLLLDTLQKQTVGG